jgi:hypothetical protein
MSNTRRTRRGRTPATTPAPTGSVLPDPAIWTAEQIVTLGAITDLRTAGQIFGLSANTAYELARRDEFPVPVIRAGSQYRIPVAPILALLGLSTDTVAPAANSPPDTGT